MRLFYVTVRAPANFNTRTTSSLFRAFLFIFPLRDQRRRLRNGDSIVCSGSGIDSRIHQTHVLLLHHHRSPWLASSRIRNSEPHEFLLLFSILLKERGYKNRRSGSSRIFIRRAMYPKLKVKVKGRVDSGDRDDVKRDVPKSPLLGLKALDYLSLHDFDSPVQEHQVFRQCTARVEKRSMENALRYPVSEGKSESTSDEDSKLNIRASTVPRPRAVLSSPDNDVMIGKNNKRIGGRPSALKNNNPLQLRNGQPRDISKEAAYHEPKSTRKPQEATDDKILSRRTKDPANTAGAASQRTRPQTRKPSSVRI
ncbi:uncharacterized protein LOC115730546 [Rhodamnia argentea]|uniref:Uncharacterized protein LOC115730546 n=1 Tax=Rhodamnia argentea TaxID=178133 RepID=A0ABM3GTP8_9MYRT|nr:uncharacterized protein LOC115730546 [Rhodamnia argentea]